MKSYINHIIIAIAIILFAIIAGSAFKYKYKAEDTISVTGGAEKDFVSDLIAWNANYSRTDMDLKTAYSLLKNDENAIRQYLQGKGISANEIVFSSVDINKNYSNKTNDDGRVIASVFSGYTLKQTVTIESKSVEKVEAVSREITELIQSGIELSSSAPLYYYSKLSELKIDLLAKAGADAKMRAETIAKNAGHQLGALKQASMGVFQIIGKNSDEDYSYGGAFNTTSKIKTATITLRAEYATN